jgi:putative lipoic acid-binding regulatory protein
MKTKLNELLEFPTPFTYKVMGQALPSWLIRWLKWYSAMRQ